MHGYGQHLDVAAVANAQLCRLTRPPLLPPLAVPKPIDDTPLAVPGPTELQLEKEGGKLEAAEDEESIQERLSMMGEQMGRLEDMVQQFIKLVREAEASKTTKKVK